MESENGYRFEAGANILGFMGSYGKSIALPPDIISQVKQHVELMKDQKIQPIGQTLEKALVTVEQQAKPVVSLGVLWTGLGETGWKLSASPPLYIYLAPWLTTFSQTPAPSRVNLQDKPHILFVVPYQSRVSLLGALERHCCPFYGVQATFKRRFGVRHCHAAS